MATLLESEPGLGGAAKPGNFTAKAQRKQKVAKGM